MGNISDSYRLIVLIAFLLYTVAVVAIVLISKRRQKKQLELKENFEKSFFVGGRKMSGLVLGLLMMATLSSSGTFISAHGMSYKFGLALAVVGLAAASGFFLVLAGVGKKIGIVSRRIEAVSVTGVIKSRYNNNKIIVVLLSLIFLVFLSVYSAAQIMGGARVFEFMTGGSYVLGLLLFGVIVGVYTLIGGMKSVATAGLFQGIIMVVSTIFFVVGMFIFASKNYGGMANLLQTFSGTEMEPMIGSTPVMPAIFVVTLIIQMLYCTIGQPHMIQGTMTYKKTGSLKKAIVVGLIASTVVGLSLMLVGPMARAINPNLEAADFATPLLSFTVLPAPFTGILLSGVTAAIQSTIASMMLIICSTIAKDVFKDIFKPKATEKQMKGVTLGVLIFTILVMIILSINPPEVLQLIVIFAIGGLGSTLIAPLLLGLYWKRTNEYGCLAGAVLGLATYIVAQLNAKALMNINPFIFSIVVSILATVIVSLVTPKPPRGIIEVWFGKRYNKEFALSRKRVK